MGFRRPAARSNAPFLRGGVTVTNRLRDCYGGLGPPERHACGRVRPPPTNPQDHHRDARDGGEAGGGDAGRRRGYTARGGATGGRGVRACTTDERCSRAFLRVAAQGPWWQARFLGGGGAKPTHGFLMRRFLRKRPRKSWTHARAGLIIKHAHEPRNPHMQTSISQMSEDLVKTRRPEDPILFEDPVKTLVMNFTYVWR